MNYKWSILFVEFFGINLHIASLFTSIYISFFFSGVDLCELCQCEMGNPSPRCLHLRQDAGPGPHHHHRICPAGERLVLCLLWFMSSTIYIPHDESTLHGKHQVNACTSKLHNKWHRLSQLFYKVISVNPMRQWTTLLYIGSIFIGLWLPGLMRGLPRFILATLPLILLLG